MRTIHLLYEQKTTAPERAAALASFPLGLVAAEHDFISISIHQLVEENIPPSWVELQDV